MFKKNNKGKRCNIHFIKMVLSHEQAKKVVKLYTAIISWPPSKSAIWLFSHLDIPSASFSKQLINMGTQGFKRIGPLYTHAPLEKANEIGFDYSGALNLTIVAIGDYDTKIILRLGVRIALLDRGGGRKKKLGFGIGWAHKKNLTKCLRRWEPGRMSTFFFRPSAHLCAITYIMVSRQPVHHPILRLHLFLWHHFSICLKWLRFGLNTTENMKTSSCWTKFFEKMWIIQTLSCLFSPTTVWSIDMSWKCEMHI